jgi:hypothetical protein
MAALGYDWRRPPPCIQVKYANDKYTQDEVVRLVNSLELTPDGYINFQQKVGGPTAVQLLMQHLFTLQCVPVSRACKVYLDLVPYLVLTQQHCTLSDTMSV